MHYITIYYTEEDGSQKELQILVSDEAEDYIAALEFEIRALRKEAEDLENKVHYMNLLLDATQHCMN